MRRNFKVYPMKSLQFNRAFTLIELLVVIAIVGILTGFIFVSLNGATSSAKDAKVKADLATISKAIMAYDALNNVSSPSTETNCNLGGATNPCTTLQSNLQPFLKNFSSNPNGGYYIYNYNAGNFTLSGTLSNTNTYLYSSSSGSWTESSSPYPTWSKRAPITVTNPASVANYQHYLSITYDSDMNVDFSDLRFTDSSGNICSYWIESKTNSSSAVVWVKVPTANQTTIYMYYGNAGAVSESNGSNVFELFDHFDGSTLNAAKWTQSGGNSAMLVGSSRVYDGSGSGTRYQALSISTFSYNTRFVFSGWINTGSGEAGVIGTTGIRVLATTAIQLQGASTQNTGLTSGQTYRYEIIRNGSTNCILKINGSQLLTDTYNSAGNAQVDIYVSNGAVMGVSVDYMFVTKYTATEPTSVCGTEQSNF